MSPCDWEGWIPPSVYICWNISNISSFIISHITWKNSWFIPSRLADFISLPCLIAWCTSSKVNCLPSLMWPQRIGGCRHVARFVECYFASVVWYHICALWRWWRHVIWHTECFVSRSFHRASGVSLYRIVVCCVWRRGIENCFHTILWRFLLNSREISLRSIVYSYNLGFNFLQLDVHCIRLFVANVSSIQ